MMGEVIHYDFRGGKGITDRYLAWPEIPLEDDLIEQAKNIYAAQLLSDGTTPTVITDQLSVNLDRCLNALGPRSDKLIEEIYSDATKIAKRLRKEII
jgi:hypothetical protein